MAKIIDLDIVLPLIVVPVQPNTVEVGTPVVTNIGSTSFDVEQAFSSEVDYYGGVYVGETAEGNDDATLVKNPSIISKTITGLRNNTTYYVNGVALPVVGNISIGQQIAVTTKYSPIPGDLQLIEYFVQNGVTSQIVLYQANGWNHKVFDLMVTRQDRNLMGATLNLWWGADRNGYWVTNNNNSTVPYLNRRQIVERNTVSGTLYVDNTYIGTTGGVDEGFLFLVGYNAPFWCNFYKLEGYADATKVNMTHNCYPVRSLDGTLVGLYDLITDERIMVPSSIWQPGPDKEWEE